MASSLQPPHKNLLVDYVQRLYKIDYYVRYKGNEYTNVPYIVDHVRANHGLDISTFDLMRIGRTDRGDVLIPIPDRVQYYTLYRITHIPEENSHNRNTVLKIENMDNYIAVSRDRTYYTTAADPCSLEYCFIDNVPVYKVSEMPSCTSSLFFNNSTFITQFCHYKITEKTSLPIISHTEDKIKIYSMFDDTIELRCHGEVKEFKALSGRVLIIRLKPACLVRGTGYLFAYSNVTTAYIPPYTRSRTENYTLIAARKHSQTATNALFTGIFSYVPSLASVLAIIYVLIKMKQHQLSLPRLVEMISAQELQPMTKENCPQRNDSENNISVRTA